MNSVLKRPANGQTIDKQDMSDKPLTFLHSEPCGVDVMDQPYPDIVAENDTFIQSSGDSDTC